MNLSAGTLTTYRQALGYILPVLGDHQLRQLTPARIDAFLADELERLAPSTVHRHYRTIRRLCQVAVLKGELQTNPCDAVTPPRIPDREMRFLTVNEVERLAASITERYRAWVLVAAYAGLRWMLSRNT